MKAILISIKPKYAAAIYTGVKTIVLRKRVPNIPIGTPCLIYETSPVCQVTGWFIYSGAYRFRPDSVTWSLLSHAQVSNNALQLYYSGRQFGYAWVIDKPTKFAQPIPLTKLTSQRPPQSYQFLPMLCEDLLELGIDVESVSPNLFAHLDQC